VAWLLQPANIASLTKVLTYHVIAGNVTSNQLTDGEQVTTLEGQNVTVSIYGNQVVFNEVARVLQANLAASNGIVHIISEVLLPRGATAASGVPALMKALRGTAAA
jgi:uncharacterized surface protein with fasciclin (FAS1) repeats